MENNDFYLKIHKEIIYKKTSFRSRVGESIIHPGQYCKFIYTLPGDYFLEVHFCRNLNMSTARPSSCPGRLTRSALDL